jgi:hypothetical protein
MTKNEPIVIDLEEITENYAGGLVDQLRQFGVGYDIFETWVPDPNPAKSIVNLVDASVEAGSSVCLKIKVSKTLMESLSVEDLIKKLDGTAGVQVEHLEESAIVYLTDSEHEADSLKTRLETRWTRAKGVVSSRELAKAEALTVAPALGRVPAAKTACDRRNSLYDLQEKVVGQHERILIEDKYSDILTAEENGRHLSFKVNRKSQIVEEAAFFGQWKRDVAALLDMLCELARNRTIQDVSDHGVGLLEHKVRGAQSPPVQGIILPLAVDVRFVTIQSFVRNIMDEYRRVTGDQSTRNFFDEGVSQSWEIMSKNQQVEELRKFLEEETEKMGLNPDTVQLVDIEYDARVLIRFACEIASSRTDKQALMMQLEHKMKDALDPRLELFLESVKDQSSLRRLGGTELKRTR